MRNFEHLTFRTEGETAYITLNNPEEHNAISPQLIDELSSLCDTIAKLSDIRVVLLKANGRNFCAGADINWMRSQVNNNFNDNKADAKNLSMLFHKLSTLPQPLVGVVQGKVYGGGLGLLACCDIVIASEKSAYCFSEVKLGLIPATITPYVIRKIGYSHCRALFVSAEIFSAEKAYQYGLVHKLCKVEELESKALKLIKQLKQNGAMAMAQSKQLLDQFYPIDVQMIDFTADMLAQVRVSDEAQQRMNLFVEAGK